MEKFHTTCSTNAQKKTGNTLHTCLTQQQQGSVGKNMLPKLLLLYMTTAVSEALDSYIDVKSPEIYNGDAEDFFGFKVLQVGSKRNKGIIVTAPLFMNGSGAVYRRGQNEASAPFSAKPLTDKDKELPVKHFGLSIAKDPTQPQVTVCSPNVVTGCNENSYINSVCYNLTEHLNESSSFTPVFQECTKKMVDLAFLFDGSGSMTADEFHYNKVFIEDIMSTLKNKNTSIKFAAIQFSGDVRTVFTFNDYTKGDASRLLHDEQQYSNVTNTHKALQFVLNEHFENPANGSTPDATKVLVLITDGNPSDSNRRYNNITAIYEDKNIIRFVIGVKKEVDLEKLKKIASKPENNNTFHIEKYDGLTGVLQNLEKKIFQSEGSKEGLAGSFGEEMSQTGFSVAYSRDALLLGSVGSQNRRGSLHELRGETEIQLEDSQLLNDSYMGYSVSVGEKNQTVLYFTGAPRYNHTGQVLLFSSNSSSWTFVQRITGDQHGSYFGGEVCSVDLDSDGNTDFLLVGAPLFYRPHEKREGKIYSYRLTHELELVKVSDITALVMGRFGTTIASVADVNGDGLRDVAVGAPLENNNRGAVYLFLGNRTSGMRSSHSQRILGEGVHPGLQFFGQSIDGSIDLGDDGLPDLLVGSRGAAVVLRSKPVLNVTTRLTFEPPEINIDKIVCPSNTDEFVHLVTLTICFEMIEATKSITGAVQPGLNVSYSLDVDPEKRIHRGFVDSTTRRRNFTETHELRQRDTCFNRSVYMRKCVADPYSPIKINMKLRQVDPELANTALNSDNNKESSVEVPFERRCRNKTCIAEIEVDFHFLKETLVVGDGKHFSVSISLFNRGEDSYNTSLTIYHPPGLSYSRMTLAQGSKSRPLYICNDDFKDRTRCSVSLPVYPGQSETTFTSLFHVKKDYEWEDSLSINITGNSENQKSTNGSQTKVIPVQSEITMLLMEDSMGYLNFTTEEPAPKRLVTKYKVDNRGWKAFPANITLFFPTKLEHNFEMNNYQVQVEKNTAQCREAHSVSSIKPQYCVPERQCKYFVCDTFLLNNGSAVELELSGDAHFKDLSKYNVPLLKRYTGHNDFVKFESFLQVSYDKDKFALDSENQQRKSERPDDRSFWNDNDPTRKSSKVSVERILLPDKILIVGTGAGGGLFLLLIIALIMVKLGCFKRKLRDMVLEEEGAVEAGGSGDVHHSEDKEDKEERPEEKSLLDSDDKDSEIKEIMEKED